MTYATEAPDASVQYVPHNIREYVRSINTFHVHPKLTYQGYDFNMNLDVFL